MPFQNNIEFNQYINSGANEKGFAANSNVKIFSNSANQGGTRVPYPNESLSVLFGLKTFD